MEEFLLSLLYYFDDAYLDDEEEEQGNDWLFTVIANIISAHNTAIEAVYTLIHARDKSTMARLLPDQPETILPTEVDVHNGLIGRFTRYVYYGTITSIEVLY